MYSKSSKLFCHQFIVLIFSLNAAVFHRPETETCFCSDVPLLKCSYWNRIEDEEWDKYIIPSKVESEKYKVSRTFSFLKSRMSSTRNKTKVRPNNGGAPVENMIQAAEEFTEIAEYLYNYNRPEVKMPAKVV